MWCVFVGFLFLFLARSSKEFRNEGVNMVFNGTSERVTNIQLHAERSECLQLQILQFPLKMIYLKKNPHFYSVNSVLEETTV